MEDEFTAEEALRRIGDFERRVRRSAGKAGLVHLLAGAATAAYRAAVLLGPRRLQFSAAIPRGPLVGMSARHHGRLGARDRAIAWATRAGGVVHLAYLGMTTAALPAAVFLRPGEPGGGRTASAAALAAATGLPLLYAGGRILRTPR
ncbi:hypothetical protein GCM10010466_03970 [Planomonospora alba]|uniref:Uncharacterized protein n=1 Tax=Planomonospora alba TaxID=161354 RepID=A0ABP6MIW3_9ACTN